jgi:geranyl-CoA carboxylase alpha subunit
LGVATRRLVLACGGETRTFGVEALADGVSVAVRSDAGAWRVTLHPRDADGWRTTEVDGLRRQRLVLDDGACVHVARDAAVHVFAEPSPFPQPDASAAARVARAPVAGVVAQVSVAVGDRVAAGQPLVCVEAMKMEMWQHAAAAGVVRAVHVALRDTVAAGAVLVELDLDGAGEIKGTT